MADESRLRPDGDRPDGQPSAAPGGRTDADTASVESVATPEPGRSLVPYTPPRGSPPDQGEDGGPDVDGPFGGFEGGDVLKGDDGTGFTARYLELARRDAEAVDDNPDNLPGWSEHWVFTDPELEVFGRF